MRIPEYILKNIEEDLKLRPNGDYEVRIYTLVCALNKDRLSLKEKNEQLLEILKACVSQMLRTGDKLNQLTCEGNELTLRAMDFFITGERSEPIISENLPEQ